MFWGFHLEYFESRFLQQQKTLEKYFCVMSCINLPVRHWKFKTSCFQRIFVETRKNLNNYFWILFWQTDPSVKLKLQLYYQLSAWPFSQKLTIFGWTVFKNLWSPFQISLVGQSLKISFSNLRLNLLKIGTLLDHFLIPDLWSGHQESKLDICQVTLVTFVE